MIDNKDLKDLDIEYFRSHIGYVPQQPLLLNSTIRENIIFGRENITEEQILEACKKSNVTEFLPKMENGLDSLVGVKGGKLSGGQKQRVAIARAILTNPKFLLLDEATSALDNSSEMVVQEALKIASAGITTIIIASKLSSVINADKIIVLRKGRVVEKGTHEKLIERKRYYYSLFEKQLMELTPQKNINEIDNVLTVETELFSEKKLLKAAQSLEMTLSPQIENKYTPDLSFKTENIKLTSILKEKKCLILSTVISVIIIGLASFFERYVLSASINSLFLSDMQVLKSDIFNDAMYFILLGCLLFFANILG